jgi:hypothetical protein
MPPARLVRDWKEALRRSAAFILAVLAVGVMASSAVAGSKWTEYENSGSFMGYAYVDGNWVYGTWTYEDSWCWASDGSSYWQAKGQSRYTFESDDGAIVGRGISNYSYHWRDGAASNQTATWTMNFFAAGGGLIDQERYVTHYTFNANGELTSNFFHTSD